jgi:AcrR family transcriptional regulator
MTQARARRVDAPSRERILQVALERFGRYGYDAVSLQDIADAVGLHKSSLFHHYDSKLALVDEVLDGVVERVLTCVRPILRGEASLLAFEQGIDRLVDHFSDAPEAARLLVNVMASPDDSELRRTGSSGRVRELYVLLAEWLDRARRAGAIRRVNIRQAIPNLIGLVLFYPAVASDLAELVGPEPFSAHAREIRKRELRLLVGGLLSSR